MLFETHKYLLCDYSIFVENNQEDMRISIVILQCRNVVRGVEKFCSIVLNYDLAKKHKCYHIGYKDDIIISIQKTKG